MKKAKIIVLAGQSNAVGVGWVEYLPKHFNTDTVAKFKSGYKNILINYFSHDKKSSGFVPVSVGCTEVSKNTLGPEVGIAQTLDSKYPDDEFFIIKCAFGGTNLNHDWLSPSCKGEYDELARAEGEHYRTAGWCYNELIDIMKESLAELKNQQYLPEIVAFCWMQGESDADTQEHVLGYSARYEALLSDFAENFSSYFNNWIFVDGGISEIWPLYREINEVKKAIAEKADNRFYIDTIAQGLTTKNEPEPDVDTAHYDSDCTVKLGNLFAERI